MSKRTKSAKQLYKIEEINQSMIVLNSLILDVKSMPDNLEDKLENLFQYSIEEIEIRVESINIELDVLKDNLLAKCDSYGCYLKRMNEKISYNAREDNLFQDVCLTKIQSRGRKLTNLKKKFGFKLNSFKSSVKPGPTPLRKHIGKFYNPITKQQLLKMMEEAREGMYLLDKSDVTSIRSYKNPPKIVKRLGEAICILFRINDLSWDSFRKTINRYDFLQRIMTFDIDNSNVDLRLLKKYVDEFNSDECKKCSKSIVSMVNFVVCLYKYREYKEMLLSFSDD